MRSGKGRIRNGSIPCGSTRATSGAPKQIKCLRYRSTHGSPIWSLPTEILDGTLVCLCAAPLEAHPRGPAMTFLARSCQSGMSAIRSLPGVKRTWLDRPDSVAFDPSVWSGRALQVDFAELAVCGLASMYPVSDWSCFASDHHGYQRACDLITGQASIGPFGSPVFACAGKTEPPSRLILSQTSAGNC